MAKTVLPRRFTCSTARTSICWGPASPRPTATPRSPMSRSCAPKTAAQFGLQADCRQSNREGELIEFIHEAQAEQGGRDRHQCRRLFAHLDRAARRFGGGENSGRRSAHQQHPRPREFPSSFVHRQSRFRDAFRLRHRRLPARDHWPCRQDRRHGESLTLPPVTNQKVSDQDHGAPA